VSARQEDEEPKKPRRRATTPEGREKQLVAMAYDRAEQQIRDGTVSSQTLVHFLKMGSTREVLEQQRIAHENELLRVKKEAIENQKDVEVLMIDALNAMREYKGESRHDD
jgi:hypothetical protein